MKGKQISLFDKWVQCLFCCKTITKCSDGPMKGRYSHVIKTRLHHLLTYLLKDCLSFVIIVIKGEARECKSLSIDKRFHFIKKLSWSTQPSTELSLRHRAIVLIVYKIIMHSTIVAFTNWRSAEVLKPGFIADKEKNFLKLLASFGIPRFNLGALDHELFTCFAKTNSTI